MTHDDPDDDACPGCDGTGSCFECDGAGYWTGEDTDDDGEWCDIEDDCSDCHGTGDCSECDGSGLCPLYLYKGPSTGSES